jgi:hypothetical protein
LVDGFLFQRFPCSDGLEPGFENFRGEITRQFPLGHVLDYISESDFKWKGITHD